MTQKEAVRQLLEFLPEEAFCENNNPQEAKTVSDLWGITSLRYTNCIKPYYHFSRVPCGCFEKIEHIENIFLQTPCICVKVSKNNHIIWFREHLPYQGGC